MASVDWANAYVRPEKNHLSFGIWCVLYERVYGRFIHWGPVCQRCIWDVTSRVIIVPEHNLFKTQRKRLMPCISKCRLQNVGHFFYIHVLTYGVLHKSLNRGFSSISPNAPFRIRYVHISVTKLWDIFPCRENPRCSFICCNRYRVKYVFYYKFFSKFYQVFIYFDMFYCAGYQSMPVSIPIIQRNTCRILERWPCCH